MIVINSQSVFTRIPAMRNPETFFELDANRTGTFMLRLGESNAFVYRGRDCNDDNAQRTVMSIADFSQEEFRDRASLRFTRFFRLQQGFFYMRVDATLNTDSYIQCSSDAVNQTSLTAEICGMTGFAESITFPVLSRIVDTFVLWQAIPVINNGLCLSFLFVWFVCE